MKINLINIGCKVNFAETSRLKDIFSKRGYEIVDSETEADYVLINSCTVTNRADSDCRKIIRKARRNAPNAFIGVFGCYAQTSYAELAEMDEVDASGIHSSQISDSRSQTLNPKPQTMLHYTHGTRF